MESKWVHVDDGRMPDKNDLVKTIVDLIKNEDSAMDLIMLPAILAKDLTKLRTDTLYVLHNTIIRLKELAEEIQY